MTGALLTPADMAERLGLTEKKFMELRRVYGWPHVRLGRRFRFTEEHYAGIVEAQSKAAKEQPAAEEAPAGAFTLTPRSAQRARAG